jgi:hypothetical protein
MAVRQAIRLNLQFLRLFFIRAMPVGTLFQHALCQP